MPDSDPRYLYVASPGGEEDERPCKIGISYDPANRISSLRANPFHSYGKEIDLVKVYECKGRILSTRSVENDYRDKFRQQTLARSEDWFDFEADKLVNELDNDERCSAVRLDEIGGSTS